MATMRQAGISAHATALADDLSKQYDSYDQLVDKLDKATGLGMQQDPAPRLTDVLSAAAPGNPLAGQTPTSEPFCGPEFGEEDEKLIYKDFDHTLQLPLKHLARAGDKYFKDRHIMLRHPDRNH